MILYLGKRVIKDNKYWDIFYKGVVTIVRVDDNNFNKDLKVGQELNENLFTETFYKDGYKTCVSIKLK